MTAHTIEEQKEQYRQCFDQLCAKEAMLRKTEEQMTHQNEQHEQTVSELRDLVKATKEDNKRTSAQQEADMARFEEQEVELKQLRQDLRESQVEISEK